MQKKSYTYKWICVHVRVNTERIGIKDMSEHTHALERERKNETKIRKTTGIVVVKNIIGFVILRSDRLITTKRLS